jgi:hypothetical protein
MIEFEQKYVFHPRDLDAIWEIFRNRFDCSSHLVRQFYDEGPMKLRYRMELEQASREKKSKIKSPNTYSVSEEQFTPIPSTVFEGGFAKSKRRLQKLRLTAASQMKRTEDFERTHKLTLDIFYTMRKLMKYDTTRLRTGAYVYALVAEVETMVRPGTKLVNLDFRLPKSLRPFLLHTVDSRDPRDKIFGSKSLCDRPSVFRQIFARMDELAKA